MRARASSRLRSPSELERYARATAALQQLDIEESWWPGIIAHLAVFVGVARTGGRAAVGADDDAPARGDR